MRAAFKTLLIWMVMLATPLQGVAAAAMLHCGSAHHPQTLAGAPDTDHAAHGHAGHHASPDADDADDAQARPSSAGTCSACASCFWGAALIGTLPAITHAAVGSAPPVAAEADLEAVVADGLERPPRRSAP